MPLIIEDRVKEKTTTTGTGAITLTGTLTGFRRFSSVCSIGDTVYAAIVAVDASGNPTGAWEIGLYTYSALNTLARTIVNSSSNSNAIVNFGSGTKHVYIDFTASQIKSMGVNNTSAAVVPFGLNPALFTGLKFQDEFSGATLDATKWDNKLWYETAPATANYNVSNGSLNMWPFLQTDGTWINRAFPCKFYQIYGYYEMEAQLPTGAGIIPAFWLFSHDLDAQKPVIDVMKSYGATPWEDAQRHFKDFQATVFKLDNTELAHRKASDTVGLQDMSIGFHKFGVLWEPTGFTFYLDGIQLGTKIATTENTNRMYPILSLYTGAAGSPAGVPSAATTPQGASNAFKVNYVRIWQLINAPAGSDNPTAPTAPAPTPAPAPAPSPTPTPAPPPSGAGPVGQDPSLWSLFFEDHFTGTTLNRQIWNQGIYYQASRPGTWKVENSDLVLCVQNKPAGWTEGTANCTIDTDPAGLDVQGPGFETLYGYFECRMKCSYGNSTWPAFWLFRHDRREIDIMEAFVGAGPGWNDSNFHPTNAAWAVHKDQPAGDTIASTKLSDSWYNEFNGGNTIDLSAGYHTYACDWGPGYINFYFDGKPMRVWTGSQLQPGPLTTRMTEFNAPMYIMLDLWLYGGQQANTPIGFGPWETRIDYVRVWKKV